MFVVSYVLHVCYVCFISYSRYDIVTHRLLANRHWHWYLMSVDSAEAIQHNQELEFQRNRERFIFLKVQSHTFCEAQDVNYSKSEDCLLKCVNYLCASKVVVLWLSCRVISSAISVLKYKFLSSIPLKYSHTTQHCANVSVINSKQYWFDHKTIIHSIPINCLYTGVNVTCSWMSCSTMNHWPYLYFQWGAKALQNILIVPPGSGIIHQVNLECLCRVVFNVDGFVYPDSLVGTDSHTTMINGLGIVGWGKRCLTCLMLLFH